MTQAIIPSRGRAGSANSFFGKHHSEKTKETLRQKRIELNIKGENHYRWSGGSWNYWKQKALTRDHYTCQKCGLYEPEIVHVDHILPKSKYPELARTLSNLITLCPNCHARKTIEDRESGRMNSGGRKKI